MNFGKTIYELRKKKGKTQDELAAELGVTAAAVSKWEKGYSLPDILMLCALADYFQVSADALLGRSPEKKYAVIAASTPALGEKIKSLAARYGIEAIAIYDNLEEPCARIRENDSITHLLAGLLGNQFPDLQFNLGGRTVSMYLSISDTEQGILEDLRNSLQNNS